MAFRFQAFLALAILFLTSHAQADFSAGLHRSGDQPGAFVAAIGGVFHPAHAAFENGARVLHGPTALFSIVGPDGQPPPVDLLEAFFGPAGRQPGVGPLQVSTLPNGTPTALLTEVDFSFRADTTVAYELQFSFDLEGWVPVNVISESDEATDVLVDRTLFVIADLTGLGLTVEDPLPPLFFRLKLIP